VLKGRYLSFSHKDLSRSEIGCDHVFVTPHPSTTAVTPGRLGDLQSWSGPVESDSVSGPAEIPSQLG
jgi:hypothetical protein